MSRKRVENTTVTRDVAQLNEQTGNIYKSISVISKRANQISKDVKEELKSKIQDFASPVETLDEIFDNREQIELARYYEGLPKPTLVAVNDFLNEEIYFADPNPNEIEKTK